MNTDPMNPIAFTPFPKLARLNRDIVITEKLDGTNAAVVIVEVPFGGGTFPDYNRIAIIVPDEAPRDETGLPETEFHVYAQSRNRFVTEKDDNYGFAGWVKRNAENLVMILGAGTHFGEWWGSGIQRGYGLTGPDKRFSLFNTGRWIAENFQGDGVWANIVPGLGVVPVLYSGPFDDDAIHDALLKLRVLGSQAVPDFAYPEGIVIWHEAARQLFKVTLEKDAAPKATPRRDHDLLPQAVAA